jgi:putative endonuclease
MTRARRAGAAAEDAAAAHLVALGLSILARNVRLGPLEIDLVAREGDVIVVVEVRTRGAGAWVRALDSIDKKKRDHLRAAGERLWRERFADDASASRLRYDAITVALESPDIAGSIEHIRSFMA